MNDHATAAMLIFGIPALILLAAYDLKWFFRGVGEAYALFYLLTHFHII